MVDVGDSIIRINDSIMHELILFLVKRDSCGFILLGVIMTVCFKIYKIYTVIVLGCEAKIRYLMKGGSESTFQTKQKKGLAKLRYWQGIPLLS